MPEFQYGGVKVFKILMPLFYFQGIFDEDSEPDLDLQFYVSRVSHLLLKHPFLRSTLNFLRRIYPWTLIAPVLCQVIFLFPMGIYLFWDNKIHVVINAYSLMLFGLALTGLMSILFQKETTRKLLEEMRDLSTPTQMDNDLQKDMLKKTDDFCYKITKHIHVVVVPLTGVMFIILTVFESLPKRQFYTREWYPWDTVESPAFEITLFFRMVETIFFFLTVNTLVSAVTTLCLFLITHFKILRNKIENIRTLAITKVKEQKLEETRRSAGFPRGVATDNGRHLRARQPHIVARCNQIKAGRAARRMKRVHLLHPLYIEENNHGPSVVQRTLRDTNTSERARLNQVGPAINNRSNTSNVNTENRLDTQVDIIEPLSSLIPEYLDEISQQELKDLEGVTPEELDREMQCLLKGYIKLHTKLLSITNTLGSLMNYYLIVMFLANVVTLGITLILTTVEGDRDTAIGKSTVVVFAIEIVGLYMMHNYVAQLISDQAEAIGEEIYCIDWTGASPSFKKSMLIIMSRANVPLEIKPTGIEPLSLKNFGEVMTNAYKMMSTMNTFMN